MHTPTSPPPPTLFYANHLPSLLDRLASDLLAVLPLDPFQPLHVITPAASETSLIQTALAARLGLCAHIRLHAGPLPFLQRLLQQAQRVLPPNTTLRDRDAYATALTLIQAFQDPHWLQDPSLRLVRAYLATLRAPSQDPRLATLQLSLDLSRLFDAYRLEHPSLLAHWQAAPEPISSSPSEPWQRALWLSLHRPGTGLLDLLSSPSLRWVDLTDLPASLPEALSLLPKHLFVFSLPPLAPALRDALAALAPFCTLHIYHLHPCVEFAEDLPSSLIARDPELAFQFFPRLSSDAADRLSSPPIRLWGRATSDALRRWLRLPGLRVDSLFIDPTSSPAPANAPAHTPAPTSAPAPSLLRQLQRDIFANEPERRPPLNALSLPADPSLSVLACPNLQREVEAVVCDIWSLLSRPASDGPPLRLTDIAIFVNVPQRDLYLSRLQATLHHAYQLPFSILDPSPNAASRYLEALRLLLSLPLGDFSRDEMLGFMAHPCCAEALQPDADTAQWATWCDQLGILRGADATAYADSYVNQDLFNWDQGIRRLFLGAWMSEADQPVTISEHPYLPLHVPETQITAAARWGLLIRSLIADATFARTASLPLRQWAQFMLGLTHYLRADSDDDQRLRGACLRALEALGDADLSAHPLPFSVAHALLSQSLDAISLPRGQHLIDGICIASLAPPVPLGAWRAVYVLGLGEGMFPAPEPPNALDLRQALRRVSSEPSPRDLDLSAFLQLLCAATDRLTLSYVAKDEQTGESLTRSYVLQSLLTILNRGYLIEHDAVITHVLAKRYDQPSPPTSSTSRSGGAQHSGHGLHGGPSHGVLLPEAQREAQTLALRRDLTERAPHLLKHLPHAPQRLSRRMDAERWRALSEHLGIVQLPDAPPRFDPDTPISLPISTLRMFLRSPLQGAARFILHLSDPRDQPSARLHEPLETDPRHALPLLLHVFTQSLQGAEPDSPQQLAKLYDQHIQTLQLQGQHPVGVFGAAQRTRHLRALLVWRRELLTAASAHDFPLQKLLLGPGKRHHDTLPPRPPLTLAVPLTPDAPPMTVHITGHTGLLSASLDASVRLLPQRSSLRDRDWLDPFLDHVLLSASAHRAEHQAHRAFIITSDTSSRSGPAREQRTLPPLPQARALQYLSSVTQLLLQHTHNYLLPIEAVLNARRQGSSSQALTAEVYQLLRQRHFSNHADMRGPIRHLHRYQPPQDPASLAQARLGLFLELLAQSEKGR
jgi:exodeoxyribonuclease V gamma subunit